ncbi:uncharacterized protein LOC133289935 [Gastrolobium bilobum]|uniref:uncharacterized protein LOC133289935 n=1 Tax=Gastrolobium bilobum TaxID=150636 RepID=UPI002AB1AF41|nr:uncharacterized protein LOC133289935 [Gastrolobium bilobum]
MKLSLKFQGHDEDQHNIQIMTAKVPITIFTNPFVSGITATNTTNSTSDFSFSLSTNFPSGPTLKLSYSPTSSLPFSLSLKSGLGIFGSARNSPLVFSATFPLSQTPHPSFFLHFKPHLGHFSLNKTVFSDPNTDHLSVSASPSPDYTEIRKGFDGVADDGSSSGWQELKLEPCGDSDHNYMVGKNDAKCGLSPSVAVMARTVMPVTKGVFLNLRWGVNFPGNLGLKMPYLTVNKIGLERVEEVKQNNKLSEDTSESDLHTLKGMCFWMRKDLEIVEKENREMKRALDEIKMGVSTRNHHHEGSDGVVGKRLSQRSDESTGEFQRWRSNKSGREENEKKQPNKSQSLVSDVESELQKAIKAATSS